MAARDSECSSVNCGRVGTGNLKALAYVPPPHPSESAFGVITCGRVHSDCEGFVFVSLIGR